MLRKPITTLLVAAGLLSVGGCSSVTGTDWLKDFAWNPMPNPESLVVGVEATSALGVLYVQGLLRTPSPCYDLSGDFRKDGNQLTLRVHVEPADGTNCDSGIGGFRYTAMIGDLARRAYQLKVIHEVTGGAGGEFDLSVSVVQ